MLVAFSVTSYSQANWTTLDYPGGTNTQPRGIDGSDIVGYYNFNSGFLYDGSNWTTLNYPGDTATILEGIDGDTIVGSFTDWDDPWPVQVGCLYDRVTATWTPLSYPGSENTEACDIDGINIVGEYSNPWPNHQSHGFLYDGSNWTTLDYPGATGTSPNGIDGDNIVGIYYDSSYTYYSFLYDGSNWTTLAHAGAIETWATGIDGSNIVGFYDDYSGTHGFLYDGSNWTTLDYPGSILTYPLGIDGSNIVGYYYDASMTAHGFLYNYEPPIPEIKANGSDGPLFVAPGTDVDITVSLDPGDKAGEWADWWGIALSSYGNFPLFAFQTPLFELPETSLVDIPLPPGWYVFLFNLDDTPDSSFDLMWYDYVVVVVDGSPSDALPDFEALVQEKIGELKME
jgi:hypothetical protein